MFLLPKTIGAFTLHRKLGTGGVAETYLGTQDGSQKNVVVRRILPFVLRDASRLASVQARVQDLAGIKHPFVVHVLDFVQEHDDVFLVEEYVDGITLDRVLAWCRQAGRTIPPNVFLNIATQVCNGLEALHAREGKVTQSENVLHLALRPGAIYLNRQGKVILGSYGLTRSPTTLPSGGVSGPVPVKMEYLSPEQTHPDQKLGPPSDIFSLASVLYELLTLESLFRAESNLQTINRIRRAEVAGPLATVRDRMPGLEKVLFRALALNPRHRYQRAFVLREDIRGLMAGYSFASIGEETRNFVAPLFEALAEVEADPVGSAADLGPGASDFADNPRTSIDPDPRETARLTSESRVARLTSSETTLGDSFAEGEHTETMEENEAPQDPPTTLGVHPSFDPVEPPTLSAVARPETTASVLAAALPDAARPEADLPLRLAPVLAAGVAVDSTAGYLASEGLVAGVGVATPPRIADPEDDNTANFIAEATGVPAEPVPSTRLAFSPGSPVHAPLAPLAATTTADPTSSTGNGRVGDALEAPAELAPPAPATPAPSPQAEMRRAEPTMALNRPMPPPSVGRTMPPPSTGRTPSTPAEPRPATPIAAPRSAPVDEPWPGDNADPVRPARSTSPIPLLLAAGAAFLVVFVCAGGTWGAASLFGPSARDLIADAQAPKVEPIAEEPAAEPTPDAALAGTPSPAPEPAPAPGAPAEVSPPAPAVATAPPAEPSAGSPAPTRTASADVARTEVDHAEPVRTTPTRTSAEPAPTRTSSAAVARTEAPRIAAVEVAPTRISNSSRTSRAPVESVLEPAVEEPVEEPVGIDLSGYSSAARSGRLDSDGIAQLQDIPSTDADYSRARAILLMNAQKKGDDKSTRRYLEELMSIPENRYNPVYLADSARYAVNQGDYKKALEQAALAERNWARLPSELVFSKKAEIYEIQAAAYQGRFYKNAEDLELLDSSIRYWRKYREHVQTKGRSDLVKKADTELERLETIQEKLK